MTVRAHVRGSGRPPGHTPKRVCLDTGKPGERFTSEERNRIVLMEHNSPLAGYRSGLELGIDSLNRDHFGVCRRILKGEFKHKPITVLH